MSKQKSNKKNEGNLYDKILKENAEKIFFPLVERVLKIKIISRQPLPEKIQTTLEREADFLSLIKTEDGDEMILHLEFQTKSDAEMVYRMGEYHGIELRKYKMKIKHIVIYLGKFKTRMKTQLEKHEIFSGFDLINVHELDAEELLTSQIPSEVIFAILGRYPKKESNKIILAILKKLKLVCKSDHDLRKYIKHLTVLGRMRNLESIIKEKIKAMPVYYDTTKDSFYIEGLEKGIKEGIEKGLEKGIKKGIRNMLKKGFAIKLIAETQEVTQKYVKQIQQEMKNET